MIEEGRVEPSGRLQEITPGLLSDVLRRCGEARIRVAGTSMLPSIRPADVLHIRSVDITSVQREDVVLFTIGRRLFALEAMRDAGNVKGVHLLRGAEEWPSVFVNVAAIRSMSDCGGVSRFAARGGCGSVGH